MVQEDWQEASALSQRLEVEQECFQESKIA
jgi:hypothetical protein